MRLAAILLISLSLTACEHITVDKYPGSDAEPSGATNQEPTVSPTPVSSPKPGATATPTPTVSPTAAPKATATPKPSASLTVIKPNIYGGTEAQRARLKRISEQTQKLINSERFKKALLSNKYNGKLGFYGANSTPQQVLTRMLNGDELRKGKVDHTWQVRLALKLIPDLKDKYGNVTRRRLGEMTWGDDELRFNTLYFNNRSDSGIAGTLCHEYSHLVGYTHSASYTSQRQYSIPYVVGTVCALVYQEMY